MGFPWNTRKIRPLRSGTPWQRSLVPIVLASPPEEEETRLLPIVKPPAVQREPETDPYQHRVPITIWRQMLPPMSAVPAHMWKLPRVIRRELYGHPLALVWDACHYCELRHHGRIPRAVYIPAQLFKRLYFERGIHTLTYRGRHVSICTDEALFDIAWCVGE